MAGIDNMGVLNGGWGICGFTSSLYALYTHQPSGKLEAAASKGSRMLAEIKTFLVTLQANGDERTLSEIKRFTRSFPGYGSFDIGTYIQTINAIAQLRSVNTRDAKYSLALPPDALVKYLRLMAGFSSARIIDARSPQLERIIGVRKSGEKTEPYDGLVHWMYQRGPTTYSWGRRFTSVTAANSKYIVCCAISPTG